VINRGGGEITNKEFDTGMPAGEYCEVLHADYDLRNRSCTGTKIRVDSAGKAVLNIGEGQAGAIYGKARVN
jgi:alpha-amylase